MRELFADLPEAIDNTLEIARRCAFMPPERKPILPAFRAKAADEAEELRDQAREGLELRLAGRCRDGEARCAASPIASGWSSSSASSSGWASPAIS